MGDCDCGDCDCGTCDCDCGDCENCGDCGDGDCDCDCCDCTDECCCNCCGEPCTCENIFSTLCKCLCYCGSDPTVGSGITIPVSTTKSAPMPNSVIATQPRKQENQPDPEQLLMNGSGATPVICSDLPEGQPLNTTVPAI